MDTVLRTHFVRMNILLNAEDTLRRPCSLENGGR